MEGNIISFKVFIDNLGVLMTEYSKLPSKDLKRIFNSDNIEYIKTILNKVNPRFEGLHNELEKELAVLN